LTVTESRQYPKQPLIGVGAIIVQGDKVVLVKRGHAPLQGEWSIPGGVLEVGETMREGVVREAGEETSLRVEPMDLLGVYDRVLRDEQGQVLYHYVLIDFLCRVKEGSLYASGDAAEARWFTQQEASALSLPADTADVIRLAFEKSIR
jgi:8-oxo-dGTP diphosphatase